MPAPADAVGGSVVAGAEHPEEVQAQEQGQDNPRGDEAQAGNDAPSEVRVDVVEELHREGQHDVCEDDLDHVEPAAGLRELLHNSGEEGEHHEGQ